jgi:hypothetical protein
MSKVALIESTSLSSSSPFRPAAPPVSAAFVPPPPRPGKHNPNDKASYDDSSISTGFIYLWSRLFGHFQPERDILRRSAHWRGVLDTQHGIDAQRVRDSIKVRGLFEPSLIFDTAIFSWLKYGHNDEHRASNRKEAIINVQGQTGVMSALIATIWYSFLQQAEDIAAIDGVSDSFVCFYVVIWLFASFSTMLSTVLGVCVVLGIDETGDDTEAEVGSTHPTFRILDVVSSMH